MGVPPMIVFSHGQDARATGDSSRSRQEREKQYGLEQMVLRHARTQAMELCRITKDQASRLLRKLRDSKQLIKKGERKGAYYEPGTSA